MARTCFSEEARTQSLRSTRGITLPELLISLAVSAIMSLAAIDHLPRFIQSNRMSTEVNRFLTALQLARSEAVKRGRRVVLCPRQNLEFCANRAEWENGWLVFTSDDRERDPEETLIVSAAPLAEFIEMRSGNHRQRIVYQPDGSSGGTNSSFTFCDRRGLAPPRVICLSNTGRPRVTPTRCNGASIDCP